MLHPPRRDLALLLTCALFLVSACAGHRDESLHTNQLGTADGSVIEAEDGEVEEEPAEDERARAETDPRLVIPRRPLGLERPPGTPGSADRLPAPQVDQRLTRATAGSTFALNTTAWEYAPYLARLKAEIEEHISPPAAFYYGIAAWSTRVRFRIAPDGRLIELVLLDHRGVTNLQHVALDAVRGAADFEPLPPSFPEPYLEITGGFYFNVIPGEAP